MTLGYISVKRNTAFPFFNCRTKRTFVTYNTHIKKDNRHIVTIKPSL